MMGDAVRTSPVVMESKRRPSQLVQQRPCLPIHTRGLVLYAWGMGADPQPARGAVHVTVVRVQIACISRARVLDQRPLHPRPLARRRERTAGTSMAMT